VCERIYCFMWASLAGGHGRNLQPDSGVQDSRCALSGWLAFLVIRLQQLVQLDLWLCCFMLVQMAPMDYAQEGHRLLQLIQQQQ